MDHAAPTTRRSGPRSRLAGVPTILPPPGGPRPLAQLALPVGGPPRPPQDLPPGVVHVPDWLDAEAQRGLVEDFRAWALPPAGLRHPRVPTGHLMSVQSVCLGWHWQP